MFGCTEFPKQAMCPSYLATNAYEVIRGECLRQPVLSIEGPSLAVEVRQESIVAIVVEASYPTFGVQ